MLTPTPNSLSFAAESLAGVTLVTVDRAAARTVLDWSDVGPHPVFADVPEQRTLITITRALSRGDLVAPIPSQRGELTFLFSAEGQSADARRKRFTATCVVRDIRHDLGGPGPRQLITLMALSPDGALDPITISDA